MFASHRLLLSVCLLLGASACKSGDPVQELCDLALSCSCSVPPYATAEDCVADLNMQIETMKTMAAENGLVFDQGCYDSGLTRFHDKVGCSTEFPAASSSCSLCAIVHGDKPAGAACSDFGDFDDCAANLFCIGGICSDPCARLVVDAPCVSTENGAFEVLGTCADGLYCDFTVSKTCKVRVASGGACFGFDDCEEGLVCGADGKCGAPPAEGEACTGTCAGDLICDNAVCAKAPGEGAACSMNGECAGELDCDDSNVCVAREPLLCEVLVDN